MSNAYLLVLLLSKLGRSWIYFLVLENDEVKKRSFLSLFKTQVELAVRPDQRSYFCLCIPQDRPSANHCIFSCHFGSLGYGLLRP